MYQVVSIWADGSACKAPGCGGWATILVAKDAALVVVGQKDDTTHNEVEALAVLEGLKRLTSPCLVTIYTDSTYVIDGLVAATQERMFESHNQIWEEIWDTYQGQLAVKTEYIAAHRASTAPIHRICDRLSKQASHRQIDPGERYQTLEELFNGKR